MTLPRVAAALPHPREGRHHPHHHEQQEQPGPGPAGNRKAMALLFRGGGAEATARRAQRGHHRGAGRGVLRRQDRQAGVGAAGGGVRSDGQAERGL